MLRTINTGCRNYFSLKENIERGQHLRAGAKIVSYCLILPPIIMGITLGGSKACLSLVGRVKKGRVGGDNIEVRVKGGAGGDDIAEKVEDRAGGDDIEVRVNGRGAIDRGDWERFLALVKKSKEATRAVKLFQVTDEVLRKHSAENLSTGIKPTSEDRAFLDALRNVVRKEKKLRMPFNFYHFENWVEDGSSWPGSNAGGSRGLYGNLSNGVDVLFTAFNTLTPEEIIQAFSHVGGVCYDAHVRALQELLESKGPNMHLVDMNKNHTFQQRVGELVRAYAYAKARARLGDRVRDEEIILFQQRDYFVNNYMTAGKVKDWCVANGFIGDGTTPCLVNGEPVVVTVENVMGELKATIDAIYGV